MGAAQYNGLPDAGFGVSVNCEKSVPFAASDTNPPVCLCVRVCREASKMNICSMPPDMHFCTSSVPKLECVGGKGFNAKIPPSQTSAHPTASAGRGVSRWIRPYVTPLTRNSRVFGSC